MNNDGESKRVTGIKFIDLREKKKIIANMKTLGFRLPEKYSIPSKFEFQIKKHIFGQTYL